MAFLWAVPWFFLTLAGHGYSTRGFPNRGAIGRFMAGGLIIGVLMLGGLAVSQCHLEQLAAAAVLYAFLCELYLFLFTLAGTSIGVALLLKLRTGPLTDQRLQKQADPRDMVERRLQRLHAAGLLVGDPPTLTTRGRRLVTVFATFARFFRHPIRSVSAEGPEIPPLPRPIPFPALDTFSGNAV